MDSNKASTSCGYLKRKSYGSLTIEQKLEAVQNKDEGASTSYIAKEYKVDESTVRRWIRERGKLEEHPQSRTCKRKRSSPVEKVNEALTMWFEREKRRSSSIDIAQIKAKAQEFFKKYGGMDEFKASDGWFRTWKQKNGLRFFPSPSEQLSANTKAARKFRNEIANLIKNDQLALCQVFNADETNLLYKTVPNRASINSTESITLDCDQLNDRVTIMPCCNADGTLKMPLLVIGKRENPLKYLAPQLFPVEYVHQTNASMTWEIFERWFKDTFVPNVNVFLESRGLPKKAILLVNNTRTHRSRKVLTIGEIKAVFVPAIASSLIQPLDQGIFETIKRGYKAKLLTYLLNAQTDDINLNEAMKQFNLKMAIDLISEAWDNVTELKISNCWNNLLNFSTNVKAMELEEFTSEYIFEIYKKLDVKGVLTLQDINEWIHENSNNRIIETVKDSSDENEDCLGGKQVSVLTAMGGLDNAIAYFEETGKISLADMKVFKRARNRLLRIKNNI